MNSQLRSRGLIVACMIAGAWWWLRPEPAFHPATSLPRVQPVITRQQADAAEQVNADRARPAEPVGAIKAQYITVEAAADAQDPPEVKLHLAVQDMLQTLISQGYPVFADKYLDFPFLDAELGVTYHDGDEHLDPSFKAEGFGDLSQLIAELESMQNSIPKYNHNTITIIDPKHGVNTFTPAPVATYDLPPNPGGPKQFFLQYVNGNKWVIVTQSNNTNVW